MTKEKQPVGALIKSQRFIRDNGPLPSNSSVRKMGISLKNLCNGGFGFSRTGWQAGQECLGPEAMELGLELALLGPVDNSQRFVQQGQPLGGIARLGLDAGKQAQKVRDLIDHTHGLVGRDGIAHLRAA
jgi:hypothetical protein